MSILFFVKGDKDSIGGMEEHGWAFARWLEKNNIHHHIVRYSQGKTGGIKFDIEGFGLMSLDEMATKFPVKVLFHNSGHLINHFSDIKRAFPNSTQVYRTGGNEVCQAHLAGGPSNHNERQKIWVNSINESIDVLVTNSNFTEQRYEKIGVEKELFFRAVGGTNPPVPAKNKKNDNKILKLFCSARFVAYKNHKTLIKVIHELVQENYGVELYLAGDGPLREEIQHQVKSLGLNESVIFLGEISPAEVTNLFPKIDLYIQLSIEERREVEGGFYIHTEGMGRSILAAISSGTWVIAGESGAFPEIVYGSRGVTVDPLDHRQGVNSIKEWVNEGQPRPLQTDQYSWDKYFEKYRNFLGA